MIAKNQNKALLIVAESVKDNSDWIDYMHYCLDREKGLRKEAFDHLNKFIDLAINWPIDKKIKFLNQILPIFETIPEASYGPYPQPLSERLIKSALLEWCSFEAKDSNPFRWYGKYYNSNEHLDKALEINPKDDEARTVYLNKITYFIYNSTHHLPDYYIGDPYDDIKDSIIAQKHIDLLTDNELKDYWQKELDSEMILVKNYIEWKESGHPDLVKWGKENHKIVDSGINAYYYDK